MLATLLIIRQFLQNVKEVLQPYLYERHKLGELTPRAVWDLLLKYTRLAAGKAQGSPAEHTVQGLGLRSSRPGWGPSERRSDSRLHRSASSDLKLRSGGGGEGDVLFSLCQGKEVLERGLRSAR